MSLKKLFKSLDGSCFVHYDNDNEVFCTWDGDKYVNIFDTEGHCLERMRFDEPLQNAQEAQMIIMDHLDHAV
ncbi:MAG: hypothetical protein RBU29_05430 [bacterium]|nr:hypothetical protein [bacterium]